LSNLTNLNAECLQCLNTRLKVLTKENDLNNPKQKIVELIQLLKKHFFNNLKLYMLVLHTDCKYKKIQTKKNIESPLAPLQLDFATQVKGKDELLDEDKLNQIKKEVPHEKPVEEKAEPKVEVVVTEKDEEDEL